MLKGALRLLVVAATLQGSVHAEEPPTDEIEVIDVIGIRPGVLERIATASTESIFTEDAKAENASLADLLAGVGGVWVRRFGGRGEPVELSIRGSAANQVVLTLDGVPVNNALTGTADAADYCLPGIERIDVTRGAGASQVGSGAIGGVIDLQSHAGGETATHGQFAGGAFDTFEGALRHSQRFGALDVAVGYCGFRTEGDFEFARPTVTSAGLPANFDPDEATRLNNDRVRHGANLAIAYPLLTGELRFSNVFSFVDGGTPGIDAGSGLTAGQALAAERRNASNLSILDWRGALGLGDDAFLLRGHYRVEDDRFEDPTPGLGAPIDSRTEVSTLGGQIREAWNVDFGGERHELAIRADATRDELRANDQSSRQRNRAGVGIESTLRASDERIVLTAGVRLDGSDGFASEWLPQAGLALTPVPWLRVTGNLGRAYRIPNFNELFLPNQGFIRGNAALRPEDAWNFDAALDLQFDRIGPLQDLRLRGAGFHREIDQSIVWVRSSPFTIEPINTGEATVTGFEAGLSFAISEYVRVAANHVQTDTQRDATRRALPGHPEHESFVRIALGPQDVLKVVGELQDTGEILVNEGGSQRLPARTVWNASVSVNFATYAPLAQRIRANEIWGFFEINNISDEAVRDSVSFPQPGRHASAGIEIAW